jgi:hypothetical protein
MMNSKKLPAQYTSIPEERKGHHPTTKKFVFIQKASREDLVHIFFFTSLDAAVVLFIPRDENVLP